MAIREAVLLEGQRDWVDAAWVYSLAIDDAGKDPTAMRHICVGLIAELLSDELMEAGDYVDRAFRPWDLSTGEAIIRVAREWLRLSPEGKPEMYSIVWLRNTERGDAIAKSYLEATAFKR